MHHHAMFAATATLALLTGCATGAKCAGDSGCMSWTQIHLVHDWQPGAGECHSDCLHGDTTVSL